MITREEILEKAREIYDESEEFNRMTWHGPYQDSFQMAFDYAYRMAHGEGYRKGCEDSR